ncbi:hypothetical protein AB0B66_30500 [Catellatospora sp. NPDC049111]|uniref:hypothetical protein n=1 Tax=Catellatospora sp. NPDC049111 TaxID=3155271 RepID=UPI0033CBEE81
MPSEQTRSLVYQSGYGGSSMLNLVSGVSRPVEHSSSQNTCTPCCQNPDSHCGLAVVSGSVVAGTAVPCRVSSSGRSLPNRVPRSRSSSAHAFDGCPAYFGKWCTPRSRTAFSGCTGMTGHISVQGSTGQPG